MHDTTNEKSKHSQIINALTKYTQKTKQYDNKFRDNNASQAMMLFYSRVPHSSVMYYVNGIKGRQVY